MIPFDCDGKNVLVVGAGGGFDFVCGLPIVFELEDQGCAVFIANYSFTDLSKVSAEKASDKLICVTADSIHIENGYFPEKHLASWYRKNRGIEKEVWCLGLAGVIPTTNSYNYLIEKYNIDVVICIDGGVDGIFRGDEFDLGTPSMDSISVIATSLCNANQKIYACTAFGIEGAEGRVSHAQVLNRMADLIQRNAMLGISIVLPNTKNGIDFLDCANFIFSKMRKLDQSTIVSSIVSAMNGNYGNTAVNAKTEERTVWISPLTALYWYFKAENVAQMKLFYQQALSSQTVGDVSNEIVRIRENGQIKPYESIPV